MAEEFGAALQADGEYQVTVITGLKHQKEKCSMDHFAGLSAIGTTRTTRLPQSMSAFGVRRTCGLFL